MINANVYTIDAPNAGRRLDAYVRRLCQDVPLATLMKWIRIGAVRLNGKRGKASARLAETDVVSVPATAFSAQGRTPTKRLPPPRVLFEDAHLLIVDKPAGLACHAGTGHATDSLIERVAQYLDVVDAPPGRRPGLAQRLDRGVSGIVPIGKHALSLRILAEGVTTGALCKTYRALVAGVLQPDAGDITVPLRVDDEPMGDRPRVHPDPVHGKPAHTQFRVVRRLRQSTLVEARILTGRTHQIRAHLRFLGHPILGDPRYGITSLNERLHATHGIARPCLHAYSLELPHPETGTTVYVEAPLPADMQRLLVSFSAERSR